MRVLAVVALEGVGAAAGRQVFFAHPIQASEARVGGLLRNDGFPGGEVRFANIIALSANYGSSDGTGCQRNRGHCEGEGGPGVRDWSNCGRASSEIGDSEVSDCLAEQTPADFQILAE